jgi:CubicO group peptidase (beta-lactamase class C family)
MTGSNAHPEVAELLERAVRAGMAPGAVAAWGPGGADPPRQVAVGHSRLVPAAEPATESTWYDLASLTKPLVTGTLALLAVRERALGLDSTVGEILGEAARRPIGGATVRQLLAHSAGLPAWAPLYALGGDPQRLLEAVLSLELVGWPEQRAVYGCPGFILLGAILERVLGQPLDVAFRERVVDPLGLGEAAGFRPDPTRHSLAGGAADTEVERRLCGERGLDPSRIPGVGPGLPDDGNARFLSGVAGNAGLFGTAAGVHLLASQYLRSESQLLQPNEIATATAIASGGDGGQIRGLGWQLASSPGCSAGRALSGSAFGHSGFTGTSVWVDPRQQAVFVLLANRHHPGHHEVDLHPLRRRFHALAAADLGACRA